MLRLCSGIVQEVIAQFCNYREYLQSLMDLDLMRHMNFDITSRCNVGGTAVVLYMLYELWLFCSLATLGGSSHTHTALKCCCERPYTRCQETGLSEYSGSHSLVMPTPLLQITFRILIFGNCLQTPKQVINGWRLILDVILHLFSLGCRGL